MAAEDDFEKVLALLDEIEPVPESESGGEKVNFEEGDIGCLMRNVGLATSTPKPKRRRESGDVRTPSGHGHGVAAAAAAQGINTTTDDELPDLAAIQHDCPGPDIRRSPRIRSMPYTAAENMPEVPCKCKSMCATRVCPCKKGKVKCTVVCSCKAGKCRNRVGTAKSTTEADAPTEMIQSSGSHTHQLQLSVQPHAPQRLQAQRPRIEIPPEIMMDMTNEEVWGFVQMVLQDQPELLEVLKTQHRRNRKEPDPPIPDGIPERCKCGRCRQMPNRVEQLCCGLRWPQCETLNQNVRQICLNEQVVLVAYRNVRDVMADIDRERTNKGMRHAAYRQYVMYKHGHLGKGNRVVIPSCIVCMIRDRFPSEDGHYTGFIPRRRLV